MKSQTSLAFINNKDLDSLDISVVKRNGLKDNTSHRGGYLNMVLVPFELVIAS
jgi:hypothetical protein